MFLPLALASWVLPGSSFRTCFLSFCFCFVFSVRVVTCLVVFADFFAGVWRVFAVVLAGFCGRFASGGNLQSSGGLQAKVVRKSETTRKKT